MNRLLACLAALTMLVMGVQAKPKFLPVLMSQFNVPAGSEADKAKCLNCHSDPPLRNSFGKAVEKAMTDANSDDLTPAILMALDKLDSDGDGYTNGEELRAGFLPGDPKSHPSKHEVASAPTTTTQAAAPLIPTHTFHPALVHFPIALFVLGALLEAIGIRKKSSALRDAAYWNLLAAAVSLVIVLPTGLIASFRQNYTLAWGQPVFTHLLLAVGASIGIISTAIWQKRSRPEGPGYWLLLLVTFGLVCAAGHFGGNLVY